MKNKHSQKNNTVQANGIKKESKISNLENEERNRLSLWRSPFLTLYYFTMECLHRFTELRFTIARNKRQCLFLLCIVLALVTLNYSDGPHSKGFGTAIGELPPYFMAQGARLSGKHNDEDLAEFEEIIATSQTTSSSSTSNRNSGRQLTFQKRAELFLHQLIMRAGFIGILLCASIPNPLFDLAGMTCGHFLVPFWSFFGATFIGKALIKVHLQQFTVIALSSEHHVETLVDLMGRIPVYGKSLQAPFLDYLKQQKENLHNKVSGGTQNWLQTVIFYLVTVLIVSFVVSIINAFAKNYHRRLCKWQRELNTEIFDKDN